MSNTNELISEAARPGLWLREKFTPSAWTRMLSERMVGEYGDRMEALREFDDEVDEKSKNIDSFWKALQAIRKTKSALKASKLAEVAILLNEINEILRFPKVKRQEMLKEMGALTDEDLREFENAVDIDPSFLESYHKEFHEEVRSKKSKNVQAGFFNDLIRGLVTKKLQTPEMIQRDKALRKIIDQAGIAISKYQDERKKMDKARASGDIGVYMASLDNIERIQSTFQDGRDGAGGYKAIYQKYLFEPMEYALNLKRKREETGTEVLDSSTKEEVSAVEEPSDSLKEKIKQYISEIDKDKDSFTGPMYSRYRKNILSVLNKTDDEDFKKNVQAKINYYDTYFDVSKSLEEMGRPEEDVSKYTEVIQEPVFSMETDPSKYEIRPSPEFVMPLGAISPAEPRPAEPGPAEPGPLKAKHDPTEGFIPTKDWVNEAPTQEAAKTRHMYWLNYHMPSQTRTPYTGASLNEMIVKANHKKFVDELYKVAKTGNTGLMLAMISKYSEQIEETDPAGSIKLLSLAQNIMYG